MQIFVSEKQQCSNVQYGDDWVQALGVRTAAAVPPRHGFKEPPSASLPLQSTSQPYSKADISAGRQWWGAIREPAMMEALFTHPHLHPISVSPPAASAFATPTDSCIFWDESSILALLPSAVSFLSLAQSSQHPSFHWCCTSLWACSALSKCLP